MKIDLIKFAEQLSKAVDIAEKALLNIEPYHGVRIAIMVNAFANANNYDKRIVNHLTLAALLHDLALSEYLSDELSSNETPKEINMRSHCEVGEEMLEKLPFYKDVKDSVKYHHERADGLGAYNLLAKDTPFYAQLIHLADAIDVRFKLYDANEKQFSEIKDWVNYNEETIFSKECVDLFNKTFSFKILNSLNNNCCQNTLEKILPSNIEDVSTDVLREMSSIFADITDYKSHFTWRHSMGIAEKAEIMGRFYGYTKEESDKLFVSGALHDIGKLLISDNILEKPGKLTSEEYKEIQNHALGTYDLLHKIYGMEDICRWASLHHEKLDGSGYPFGYKSDQLDKNSRLLACLDIYQALVEDRPYKSGMSHADAISILNKMGDAHQLDEKIIHDIDICFSSNASQIEPKTQTNNNDEIIDNNTMYYRCPVCGYIYKGKLPEDFICPRCEQPGSIFEKHN